MVGKIAKSSELKKEALFIERSKPVRDFYSKDFPELAAQIEALAN